MKVFGPRVGKLLFVVGNRIAASDRRSEPSTLNASSVLDEGAHSVEESSWRQ